MVERLKIWHQKAGCVAEKPLLQARVRLGVQAGLSGVSGNGEAQNAVKTMLLVLDRSKGSWEMD